MSSRGNKFRAGFTLVELLVVVAIIGILAALLLPTLNSAKQKAKKTACLSNLRQVGLGIILYAGDYNSHIPFGPKAGAFTSPMNLYPSTGAPTSLLSLSGGSPVGLGLLLSQQLSSQPKVLFCPGADQPVNADAQLVNVGQRQAQGSFYYRHAGNTRIFDVPGLAEAPRALKLDSLGNNRNGIPIRTLALDSQFLAPPGMAPYGVHPSTHHQQRFVDVLAADGHAMSRPNKDKRFTVDLGDNADLYSAFDMILKTFEEGDKLN